MFFCIACPSKQKKDNEHNDEKTVTNRQQGTIQKSEPTDHWSYAGETVPEYWSKIIHSSQCGGHNQSPIDFSGEMLDKDYVALKLDYKPDSILDIINNGHTIQVNILWGKFIYNGTEYNLVQFHFHAHSKHSLNEEFFPLGAHLVQKR